MNRGSQEVSVFSKRIEGILGATSHLFQFMTQSTWALRQNDPDIADFVAGNPQELPLPEYVEALSKAIVPQDKAWFAYKMSEPKSQEIVANTLRERTGMPFETQDVFMTDGAFAAIAVSLATLLDPGDEAIYISPPWFFYGGMIMAAGGTPVRVKVDPETFDLDVDGIAKALTDKTRAIIINSPNNPTGKIYSPETLERLSQVLTTASEKNGRPIYLISDEAYSRIIYDGNRFHSPAEFYAHTFVLYTYAKTLLTPGMRLGYIALPPTMPDRGTMQAGLMIAQIANGWAFPSALLQHALSDIEALIIDIPHLQKKRDRVVGELRSMGYTLHTPEATFYLLPKSPIADDFEFTEILAAHNVFVLPGAAVEMPGYFRISVTASDAMIDRALPGFGAAIEEATTRWRTRPA